MDLTPELLTPIATFAGGLVAGAVALGVAVYKGKVELKKRKPEAVAHRCRVCDLDVYTFITSDNKHTPPACTFLDPSDYSCNCDPDLLKATKDPSTVQLMQAAKKAQAQVSDADQYYGKCYLSIHGQAFDLA